MILDPGRILFSLNTENCPNKSYGFVKSNFFELFANKSDWTYSIKCKIGEYQNYLTLISLEGVNLSLDLPTVETFSFRYQDGLDQKNCSFKVESLADSLNEFHIITLTYNFIDNLYAIYFDGNPLHAVNLTSRTEIITKKIKLCSICRHYLTKATPQVETTGIDISNIIFANKNLAPIEIQQYFHPTQLLDTNYYGRAILKNEYKMEINCLYNFVDNINGKVWDLTENNNFFFTSLHQHDRVGYSVI